MFRNCFLRAAASALSLIILLCAGCQPSAPSAAAVATAAVTAVPTETPSPAPTPVPTPEPTATPEPTPALTGRALRAYELQQAERAYFEAQGMSEEEIVRRLDMLKIDPDKKLLALTFDDGPSAKTHLVLDALEANNARATFFVVGYTIEGHADSIPRAIDLNCEIGNHSYDHRDFRRLDAATFVQEFQKTADIVSDLYGYDMRLCRPPYGSYGPGVYEGAKEMGYALIGWSRSTGDSGSASAYAVYASCLNMAADGAIILMHDSMKTTTSVASQFIPALIEKGFQLVTVSELLFLCDVKAEPGVCYVGTREGDVPRYPSPSPQP